MSWISDFYNSTDTLPVAEEKNNWSLDQINLVNLLDFYEKLKVLLNNDEYINKKKRMKNNLRFAISVWNEYCKGSETKSIENIHKNRASGFYYADGRATT